MCLQPRGRKKTPWTAGQPSKIGPTNILHANLIIAQNYTINRNGVHDHEL